MISWAHERLEVSPRAPGQVEEELAIVRTESGAFTRDGLDERSSVECGDERDADDSFQLVATSSRLYPSSLAMSFSRSSVAAVNTGRVVVTTAVPAYPPCLPQR